MRGMPEPKDPTAADPPDPAAIADDPEVKERLIANLEALLGDEARIRLDVLQLQRKKLRQDLLHDDEYFSDWLAASEPAAKREWQRHMAALTIANGIMCGGSGTLEERLKMATDKRDALTEYAYAMAETFMQHRERLKKTEQTEGQGKEGPAPPIEVIHILRHGFALCRTVDGIPREWPPGHKWTDAEAFMNSNCIPCLRAHCASLAERAASG